MLRVSSEGLGLIRRFEGFRSLPYADVAGLATIGYGHRLNAEQKVQYAGGIDEAAAGAWLAQDVALAEQAVGRLICVPLTQGQFDALVSFTYNLGAAVLQRSTLRRVVNREEHAEVPQQFRRYVYAGGRKWPGLIRRRAAEAALYMS